MYCLCVSFYIFETKEKYNNTNNTIIYIYIIITICMNIPAAVLYSVLIVIFLQIKAITSKNNNVPIAMRIFSNPGSRKSDMLCEDE